MKRATLGNDLFLTGVMVLWGFNFVVTKVALRELDVLALIAVRNVTTVVFLLLLFLLLERRWPNRPAGIRRLLLLGLIGVTLNQITYNAALRYTSAANAALLSATTPVFALVFARLLENEHSSLKRWMGVIVALAGVALIVGGGRSGFSVEGEGLLGDLSMLIAAAALALFALLGRPFLKVCTPVEVTFFAYLTGVPLLIPVTAGAVMLQDWQSVSALGWACAFGAGIIFSVTNILLYRQIGKVGTARTMVFTYLVPISGAVMAVIFLQEPFSLWQAVGAGVVLLGVNTARTG